jgi:hypothetical protein
MQSSLYSATMPSAAETESYDALCCYTLERGDPSFIHQHVVDAFTAQHADEHTKPIALTFALVGLYLHVERKLSGRQVQLVHMALAQKKRQWPTFGFPRERGGMTVRDVMTADAGPERDEAISRWCASVWHAYRDDRDAVSSLLRSCGVAGERN